MRPDSQSVKRADYLKRGSLYKNVDSRFSERILWHYTDFIDAGDYNDDRTHNDVNELTARDTDDNGTDNFALTYFKTGAMKNDGEHYKYVWDAWGRLRKVLNRTNDNLVTEYRYNGLGFRISEHFDTDTLYLHKHRKEIV